VRGKTSEQPPQRGHLVQARQVHESRFRKMSSPTDTGLQTWCILRAFSLLKFDITPEKIYAGALPLDPAPHSRRARADQPPPGARALFRWQGLSFGGKGSLSVARALFRWQGAQHLGATGPRRWQGLSSRWQGAQHLGATAPRRSTAINSLLT
jgi:hypothetical protein